MKTTLGIITASLLAAVASWQPAYAQSTLQGSYTNSCTEARMVGQSLIAFCKKPDGTSQTAVMTDSNRCTGDISNNDGNLTCQVTPAVGTSSTPPSEQPPVGTGRLYPKAGGPSQPDYPAPPDQSATPSGQPKGY
jgi:hypothetical protein